MTTPALLGTTAKTVSQNADVRMEALVTLLMANVHVSMNGKENSVILVSKPWCACGFCILISSSVLTDRYAFHNDYTRRL